MSTIDKAVKANEAFAKKFKHGHLPLPPAKKLAIVACMDARLMVDKVLGLKTGDAHIIRNAGGLITSDALRSLIISHHLLGTEEFIIINHTDCGMLTFKGDKLRTKLEKETGITSNVPRNFLSFTDVKTNVLQQIEKIREHPWIPQQIPVRGFVYNVKTGKLKEVFAEKARAASK